MYILSAGGGVDRAQQGEGLEERASTTPPSAPSRSAGDPGRGGGRRAGHGRGGGEGQLEGQAGPAAAGSTVRCRPARHAPTRGQRAIAGADSPLARVAQSRAGPAGGGLLLRGMGRSRKASAATDAGPPRIGLPCACPLAVRSQVSTRERSPTGASPSPSTPPQLSPRCMPSWPPSAWAPLSLSNLPLPQTRRPSWPVQYLAMQVHGRLLAGPSYQGKTLVPVRVAHVRLHARGFARQRPQASRRGNSLPDRAAAREPAPLP